MGIREIITILFLTAGLFFVVVSAVGVLRMHDFYCRLHAAGVGETLGLILCSIGLFIYEGPTFTGFKILFIFCAVFLASPVGTYIIGKVCFKESLQKETEADSIVKKEGMK